MFDLGPLQLGGEGSPFGNQGFVEIYHLNMNEIEIKPIYLQAGGNEGEGPISTAEVHLMVLLKV